MTDFARARAHMIDSQVRPNNVIDLRVIAAMSEVPREEFAPEEMREYAYIDKDLFIGVDEKGRARHMLQPMTLARMLQLAEIRHDDCVLNVACASGYSTAVLAHLAQSVISLEESGSFSARATETLERLDVTNAAFVNGPHDRGWEKEAPFDVIVVNGRLMRKPAALLEQLKDLGRLVAVYGPEEVATIRVWTRRDGVISHVDEFDATAPLAPGFEAERPAFIF